MAANNPPLPVNTCRDLPQRSSVEQYAGNLKSCHEQRLRSTANCLFLGYRRWYSRAPSGTDDHRYQQSLNVTFVGG
jgi:hypothetical protein